MREYLIEKVLPSRELHLLGGPSGAGKTRLLFKWLRDWQADKPFLFDPKTGQPLKTKLPLEIAYIAYDRSQESIEETMNEEKAPIPNLHYKSARNNPLTISQIHELYPTANLIIIDGIGSAVPMGKTNDYVTVSAYLRSIGVFCTKNNVTVIGVHHTAKTKENEKYLNPRQRLGGSVSWAAFSDTIFIFEPKDPQDLDNPERELFVLPRNSREFVDHYVFRDGEPQRINCRSTDLTTQLVMDLVKDAGVGRVHVAALVADCENLFGVHRSAVYSALDGLVQGGLLERPELGYVQRV